MFELMGASENIPFTVALVLMLAIAVLEGVTTLLGAGISSLIDAILPDMDFGMDVDSDLGGVEYQSPTPLSKLLGWLRIGKVPVLMLLVVFLTAYGLIGLSLQSFIQSLTGHLVPGSIASIPAIILALPVVRMVGGIIGRILPSDETDAVTEDSLVGLVATITLGSARVSSPAQAKVRDIHGTTHYLMVEPDAENEEFAEGSSVLLVKRKGALFKAILNTNTALVDKN